MGSRTSGVTNVYCIKLIIKVVLVSHISHNKQQHVTMDSKEVKINAVRNIHTFSFFMS